MIEKYVILFKLIYLFNRKWSDQTSHFAYLGPSDSWGLGFSVSKLGKSWAKWNELVTLMISSNPLAMEEIRLMFHVLLVIIS